MPSEDETGLMGLMAYEQTLSRVLLGVFRAGLHESRYRTLRVWRRGLPGRVEPLHDVSIR